MSHDQAGEPDRPVAPPLGGGEPDDETPPGVESATEADDHDAPTPDDVRFLLATPRPTWWTPQRFVIALTGFVLAILLGIGVLFWLSITAFEKQRSGDTVPSPTPTSLVTAPEATGSVPD